MSERFLLEQPLSGPGIYRLGVQESHHAARVMRVRPGDAVVVFDGEGNYAEATVESVEKDAVAVRVDGVRSEAHLPLHLTIATAIPKGKRWQTLVEKCTELGADCIWPLLTRRSVAKGEGDAERWRRWIIEAAKQSRRAWLPEIWNPLPLPEAVSLARNQNVLLFYADPVGESPTVYAEMLPHALQVVALIGPEGGFADEELELIRREGGKPVRLSPFILRVETAAATMCAIIREVL